MIDALVNNFDAEDNEMDRRIFYEITGLQFNEGEFDDSDTFDDGWCKLLAQDPQWHAFNYTA